MTTVETRWWWIRHAPVTTPEHIYGQRDLPADTSHAPTFEALAALLPEDAVLVTSDLQRTIQTAAAIGEAGLDLPEPIVEESLREQHFGDWQGVPRENFHESQNREMRRFWLAPAQERAPNGESFVDVMARVAPTVMRLTAAHAGRDIVCVAHGGTIRAALAMALILHPETALSFTTANCSVTRIDHLTGGDMGDAWRVGMVNWNPHQP